MVAPRPAHEARQRSRVVRKFVVVAVVGVVAVVVVVVAVVVVKVGCVRSLYLPQYVNASDLLQCAWNAAIRSVHFASLCALRSSNH